MGFIACAIELLKGVSCKNAKGVSDDFVTAAATQLLAATLPEPSLALFRATTEFCSVGVLLASDQRPLTFTLPIAPDAPEVTQGLARSASFPLALTTTTEAEWIFYPVPSEITDRIAEQILAALPIDPGTSLKFHLFARYTCFEAGFCLQRRRKSLREPAVACPLGGRTWSFG